MPTTSFNDQEDEALRSLPWRARVVYLQGIRRHMDYATGWSGKKRVLSYQFFFELLDCTEHTTSPDPKVSKDGLRAIFKMLERVGLVQWPRGSSQQRGVVFKCLLADTDKSVQKQDAPKTHPRRTQQDTPSFDNQNNGLPEQDAPKTHPCCECEDAPPPESVSPQKIKPQHWPNSPQAHPPEPDPAPQPADAGEREKSPRAASRFEDWWQQYPRKVGKKAAREKWKAKSLDNQADQLIADVQLRAGTDRKWLDGYIPNPLTYLTQERWDDEIDRGRPNLRAVAGGGRRGAEGNDAVIQRFIDQFPDTAGTL